MLYSTSIPEVKKKMQTKINFFCATLAESDRLTSSTLPRLREAQSLSKRSGLAILIKSLVNIKEFDTHRRFQCNGMFAWYRLETFPVGSLATRVLPPEHLPCGADSL